MWTRGKGFERVVLYLLAMSLALGALTGVARAQAQSGTEASQSQTPGEEPTPRRSFYRLDFTLRELEGGKVVNSRQYSISIGVVERTGPGIGSLRSGVRIAIPSEKSPQYLDVGVNIDCRLWDEGGIVYMTGSSEVSSLAPSSQGSSGPLPELHSSRNSFTVHLVPGERILLSSIDDPTSTRRMELEVTPIKLN